VEVHGDPLSGRRGRGGAQGFPRPRVISEQSIPTSHAGGARAYVGDALSVRLLSGVLGVVQSMAVRSRGAGRRAGRTRCASRHRRGRSGLARADEPCVSATV